MKRFIIIALASLHLFSSTDLHQLLKIPVLIQHFYEHKSENPDISLGQFITLHYFSGDIHDADYDRDQQLPFKQIDTHCFQVLAEAPASVNYFIENNLFSVVSEEMTNNYPTDNLFVSNILSSVWRPPICKTL